MRRAFKFGDQNGRQSANEQIPRVEHVHEFRLSLRIASNLHCSFSQQGSGHADSEAWRKCASPGATVACRRDGYTACAKYAFMSPAASFLPPSAGALQTIAQRMMV